MKKQQSADDVTAKQPAALTVRTWMKRGTEGHMVIKAGKGHYILLGRLSTLEGLDLGMMQVGHIYATGMPTYTWLTRPEVESLYGAKRCYPADTFDFSKHEGR